MAEKAEELTTTAQENETVEAVAETTESAGGVMVEGAGLIGRKCGMTRIFTENGESIPVSVIEVLSHKITQVKTDEKDGYSAIVVTTGERRASRMNKAEKGQFAKADVATGRGLWEFRVPASAIEGLSVGNHYGVETFVDVKLIDVTGTSKGKGFQGGVKRWNFRTQDMTHGNSLSHRANGSIGQNQTPGRVFKGKKMSGHMGDERCTVQSLEIVRVDQERNLLLVKGGVPGAKKGDLIISRAEKAKGE